MSAVSNPKLGIRPLNARSLVLSVLLGQDPPVLSTPALMTLAEVFGIAPGTMRTALSRLAAGGELAATDGGYRLVGRLLERKAAQDIGRRPAGRSWDGQWHVAVVTLARRSVAERRTFRTHMANLRMGELRPDTWMRPANLDGPDGDEGLAVVRGPLTGEDAVALAGRLWPLGEIARHAEVLLTLVEQALPELEDGRPEALASTIALSAGVVRFLRAEPLLPPDLTPQPWPPDVLRARYLTFDLTFGRLLARTVRGGPR